MYAVAGATAELETDQRALVAGITDALRAARVPHVVLLSSMGAELPAGTGPITGLHAAEGALRAIAGTASTALRSVYFMENVAGSLDTLESGLLGREIAVLRVPFEAMVGTLAGAGVPTRVATAYREMMEALAAGRIGVAPGHERHPGVTDLPSVLAELVAPSAG